MTIVVEDLTMSGMSDQDATVREYFMKELLEEDANEWASLMGMLAQLALPPLRAEHGLEMRRAIEIERPADSGNWILVESITIEPGTVTFRSGHNGSTQAFTYRRREKLPRWRPQKYEARPYIGDR